MKEQFTLKSVYFLKILFILLNFIIPAILILWGSSEFGPFTEIPVLRKIIFGVLFFLVLPVTVTYLIVSLNRIFHKDLKKSFFLFAPYIINLVLYSVRFGFTAGFFEIWMVQSLPLFLGYILALVIGFIILAAGGIGNLLSNRFTEILSGSLLIIFLVGTFFISWVYIFLTGTNYLLSWGSGITQNTAIIYFSISIIMVFLFHFSLLKILYKEGKL